ncbi:RNA 2'-phosphotransferase [Deinococcus sonorensis]|uniref:Probable RNA 2'-phosphotransferase n=2 Tax=Deinococcus sonorensis TaxID=309891 RepID=A0AAU7U8N9_9DEIO
MTSDHQLSRTLSFLLRHAPQQAGLTLQPGGWVSVDDLLRGLATQGLTVDRAQLERVVATSDKQRFTLDAATDRIRANQGHSVPVDLGLTPLTPPPLLYHGTAVRLLDTILREGLRQMQRHHVHLSADPDTARRVGHRRGPAVILTVDAFGMLQAGHLFFRSSNGVWLTERVPPEYVRVLK